MKTAKMSPSVVQKMHSYWPALISCSLFLLLAILLIPYPGLQEDEVLFGPPIFHPIWNDHVTIGHLIIPRMLMSYLGATKSWLFFLIFKFWKPSPYAVRVPAAMVYALTIWIFYSILQMIHSWRAAAVGALLLATDPVYVLAGGFGWCNLQNVFMLASIGAFLMFYKQHSRPWLACAAFFAGLWIWDKAVGLWMLSGLVLAVAILFPRETWRRLNGTNVVVAMVAFCLGALLLISYNIQNHYPTLRSNAHFSTVGLSAEVEVLRTTANGSAWLGILASEPGPQTIRTPHTSIERWSAALHDYAGEHRSDYLPYVFGGSILLLPLLVAWRRYAAVRTLAFSLMVMSAAWLQMAFTEGAGTGGHHPALMWPFPHLFIAVAFAEVSLRWKAAGGSLLAGVIPVLMVSNMLTVNQYLYQLARFGAARGWSDAILTLSNELPDFHAAQIFIPDWGIINPLTTLSRGRLPVRWEGDPFSSDSPSPAAARDALEAFATGNSIWVTHTAANEMIAGANARLDKMAAADGYHKIELGQVSDSNQRTIFEVFRIVPGSGVVLHAARKTQKAGPYGPASLTSAHLMTQATFCAL